MRLKLRQVIKNLLTLNFPIAMKKLIKEHLPVFNVEKPSKFEAVSSTEDIVPIEKLDFHHYLPMFFDGLAEGKYPFSFIVEHGIDDMITKGAYKILPIVPQLIIPIKKAFETKRPSVLCHALKCLQMIVTGCDKVGEALVPYYRQILPTLNLFKNINATTGSEIIDQMASSGENVSEMIENTLQILEEYGGPDAYINIKYQIPTYESCRQN